MKASILAAALILLCVGVFASFPDNLNSIALQNSEHDRGVVDGQAAADSGIPVVDISLTAKSSHYVAGFWTGYRARKMNERQ